MHLNTEEVEAYIGTPKTFPFYMEAFEKYSEAGVDQFRWHWSWWAFGGGLFYLLYRKLYIEAVAYFLVFALLSPLPLVSLILWIASGGVMPYFVYKRYKKMKAEVEQNISDPHERLEAMRKLGGVNKWAIWLGVGLTLLFWIVGLYMAFMMANMPTGTTMPTGIPVGF